MNGPTSEFRPGEILGGKYRIVGLLGEGGMAVVYEAQHMVVKRRFAVKLLRPNLSERREILERFRHEAEAAGALESENIAAAVDFGIATNGSPYIVMEHLVGESLAALLAREHRLPAARATDLCGQACRGVQAAHDAGIVHRDLKPQNLFVCRREDGTDLLKILDFGIAKLAAVSSQGATTSTGAMLGTPAYMSPEQARGDRATDHRTDVYALGAVLYELLSGQRPHPGDSPNAILHHIATQPAIPLTAANLALPLPLVAIVHQALDTDARARFASAQAFEEALAPYAERRVWPQAKTPHEQPVTREQALAAQPVPARPRRRTRLVLIAALAFSAVALFGIRLFRPPGPPPRMASRALTPSTQFFVPPPPAAAVQQIASRTKSHAPSETGSLAAMTSTPRGVWFVGGTPGEVQNAVRNTMVRASREQLVPILVAYNLPYRDCAGYGAGGAATASDYKAWIEGFASGIGNEKAVVILEPDSVGIVPYATTIKGLPDWCKPTVTDAQGKTIPAPAATPEEHYAQLNQAVDTLVARAPNAAVYLDGTHSAWLPVGEVAYRLVKAGVHKVQGFAVNVSNFQPMPELIQYGTFVSKCIYYADNPALGRRTLAHYAACGGPSPSPDAGELATGPLAEAWYAANVDHATNAPSDSSQLVHFVIDTSRNGRGRLDTARYAKAPFDQPAAILEKLSADGWCNPPGAGLGLAPSANPGIPLVDAFVWVKTPGESDGACDIAGGARAWDYTKYNPWGLQGDAQNHFDPLWGMVDPGAGEWFPEQALQLVENANPPLGK